jgi:hypothetical protein
MVRKSAEEGGESERRVSRILGGEQTELGRALHAPPWLVPNTHLLQFKGEPHLEWALRDHVGQSRTRLPLASEARGALDEFVKLRDANPQRILEFAQKRGVLGLCVHGRPFTHSHRIDITAPTLFPQSCLPTQREPLSAWRTWANKAFQILVDTADLINAPPLSRFAVSERRKESAERSSKWNRVIRGAQDWLNQSAVSWTLLISTGSPKDLNLSEQVSALPRRLQLAADCPMLFDVLAFQLAQTVTRSEGLYVCDGCNQPFFRAWRASTGKRVFCRDCGKTVRMRDYMREKRAKLKRVKNEPSI